MNRREALGRFMSVALSALFVRDERGDVPVEHGPFRKTDLVELVELDPTIRLDVRYATSDNFLKVRMYDEARAFLQRPAAEALVRVNQALRSQGYGLLVYDAYRPWSVTRFMWEHARSEWREGGYLANPAQGSQHNRGCAVDLTMYNLSSGEPVEMPTDFDDFRATAHADAVDITPAARCNRELLVAAMRPHGFNVLREEWWHFDFQSYREYPILDVGFASLCSDSPQPQLSLLNPSGVLEVAAHLVEHEVVTAVAGLVKQPTRGTSRRDHDVS